MNQLTLSGVLDPRRVAPTIGPPSRGRAGRKVLIRTDTAGCAHEVLDFLTGQRLS